MLAPPPGLEELGSASMYLAWSARWMGGLPVRTQTALRIKSDAEGHTKGGFENDVKGSVLREFKDFA